ncbi:MAG TPA: tetratricopeptide repeat protein [Candidatus Xenobia bacterium]|jgi:tetratricopeptide (TPR) repeat protein
MESSYVLSPGAILKDRYCIQRIIHQDGPVVEYLAQDCANGARYRVRQVHMVYTDPNTSRRHRQSFRDTAPQLIGLHHRALVAVLDCYDEGPDFFTIAAWIEGPSLAATPVPVSTEVALRWVMDILEAMEVVATSSARIMLPVLSPHTIRVRENGTIVIGSLRCIDDGTPQDNTPTPFYNGETPRSFKTDVYTLGALAWWLVTGQYPPSPAERKTPPIGVSATLHQGLLRMMNPDPRRRPGSPTQARQCLIQSGAHPQGQRRRPRPMRWPAVVGTAAVAGMLVGSVPLVRDEMHHWREARHEQSIEATLGAAHTALRQGEWRLALTDFVAARRIAGSLSPTDTVGLAQAERLCWHPDDAWRVLETTTPGLAGSAWWVEQGHILTAMGRPADEAWQNAAGGDDQLQTGEVAAARHDWLTAESAFRLAATHQGTTGKDIADQVEACTRLGALLRQQGDYDNAERELQRALALDPDAVMARVELGRTQFAQGRFLDAGATYSTALHKAPECDAAWLGWSQALELEGQREDALSTAFQAVRRNPASGDVLVVVAHQLMATNRLDYARSVWELADRAFSQVHSPLAEARMALDEGRADAALQILQGAPPDDPQTLCLEAEAQVALHQGTLEATLTQLGRVTDRGTLGNYEAGLFHLAAGQVGLARADLTSALERRPAESAYLLAMGKCLLQAGDYSQGTRYLARAIMDHPSCSDALRVLAAAEAQKHHYELSAMHLQKLCEYDSRVDSWHDAGQRWVQAKRYDLAIHCYLLGKRCHPEEARFHFWLAQCFEATHRPGQAAWDYRQFLHRSPSGPMADTARERLQALHWRS